MTVRDRERLVRDAFDDLREMCDPRGYALLDALEGLVLAARQLDDDVAMAALGRDCQVIPFPGHSVKVD